MQEQTKKLIGITIDELIRGNFEPNSKEESAIYGAASHIEYSMGYAEFFDIDDKLITFQYGTIFIKFEYYWDEIRWKWIFTDVTKHKIAREGNMEMKIYIA